jgi:hypothetical protein
MGTSREKQNKETMYQIIHRLSPKLENAFHGKHPSPIACQKLSNPHLSSNKHVFPSAMLP